MTHLIIGLYTKEKITGVWGNLEFDTHTLEGVIHLGYQGEGFAALLSLDSDVKILRPKQLTIFTNDFAFAQMFTRPIRLEFHHFPLLRMLIKVDRWKFHHVDESNLRRAKEQWTLYKNAGRNT